MNIKWVYWIATILLPLIYVGGGLSVFTSRICSTVSHFASRISADLFMF